MDLWIRSQNKTGLTKINSVIGLKYNDYKTIIANYIPDFSDKYDGSYDVLGTYKSEQRALEVLNEIQEFRDGLISLELLPHKKRKQLIQDFFKDYKTFTYEMPKE